MTLAVQNERKYSTDKTNLFSAAVIISRIRLVLITIFLIIHTALSSPKPK